MKHSDYNVVLLMNFTLALLNILQNDVLRLTDWQATSKPILIYPNSGETYDGQTKQWVVSCLLYSNAYFF